MSTHPSALSQGESCLARLHQYMRTQSRATTDLVFGIREKVGACCRPAWRVVM